MSIAETVDSVPMFKQALHTLSKEYIADSALSAIVDEVQDLSRKLNRRSDIELLRKSITGLELLLSSLSELTSAVIGKTSVFSGGNFENGSLSARFDEIFTELSASLPNVFTSDDKERSRAVGSTLEHLKEIGKYAELNGNSHVVSLSEAMVSVVNYHRESLLGNKPERDNSFLVKPLLRGFALLRTAFDSPEEPNLSPALIDSTANLRDLIGAPSDDTFDFEPQDADFVYEDLADETVVQSDLIGVKKDLRPSKLGHEKSVDALIANRISDSRKTVAFTAISSPVATPGEHSSADKAINSRVTGPLPSVLEPLSDASAEPFDEISISIGDSEVSEVEPLPLLDTAGSGKGKTVSHSLPSSQKGPKKITTYFCGYTEQGLNFSRFSSIVPMSVHLFENVEKTVEALSAQPCDLIVYNSALSEGDRKQLSLFVDSLDPLSRIPIIDAKSNRDDSVNLSVYVDPAEETNFLLKYLEPEEDLPDLLSDIEV